MYLRPTHKPILSVITSDYCDMTIIRIFLLTNIHNYCVQLYYV